MKRKVRGEEGGYWYSRKNLGSSAQGDLVSGSLAPQFSIAAAGPLIGGVQGGHFLF